MIENKKEIMEELGCSLMMLVGVERLVKLHPSDLGINMLYKQMLEEYNKQLDLDSDELTEEDLEVLQNIRIELEEMRFHLGVL